MTNLVHLKSLITPAISPQLECDGHIEADNDQCREDEREYGSIHVVPKVCSILRRDAVVGSVDTVGEGPAIESRPFQMHGKGDD